MSKNEDLNDYSSCIHGISMNYVCDKCDIEKRFNDIEQKIHHIHISIDKFYDKIDRIQRKLYVSHLI